ncbi:MAG: hypothetical protein Kow00117_18980 [Phototrophicales bacterium]
MEQMNIWQFNQQLTSRLLNINILNIELGRRLSRSETPFWRGIGTQAVGWGIINIAIALFGRIKTRRRLDKLDDPFDKAIMQKETHTLQRILAINAPLNIVYIFGGWLLTKRGQSEAIRSNGWGIMLQGLILLFFDSFHLKQVSKLDKTS